MPDASVPLIGVTTYRDRAAWGSWDRDAAVLPSSYVDCVARAGARPVLLPPADGPGGADGATGVVSRLDGLVLAGGGDVDPALYGEEPDAATAGVDRRRDDHELALLAAALDADLPVLAICRGLQLLDVLLGGSLHQHLPDAVGESVHRPARGRFHEVTVTTVPGSTLEALVGPHAVVQCSHHQAVARLGAGLVVSATAGDGTVEALELPGRRFVLGVQWHPEESGDPRLFDALAAAAAVVDSSR